MMFEKKQGIPMPSHLSNSHQSVDAFLGSYRDFEVYQSGCYPYRDARIESGRPIQAWVPGTLQSGVAPSTYLDYSSKHMQPYVTHGSSLQYAYANPDSF